MDKELAEKVEELENEDKRLITLSKELAEKCGVTEYSMFCLSVLNRTLNLNRGFITLVNDNNYIAAAPLVRINLDSLLRLFASIQTNYDIETFARMVREGTRIKDFTYHKNQKHKLSDWKLVNLMKKIKGFQWVEQVYEIGSGFIHLSNQHLYSSITIEPSKVIKGGVLKTDKFISSKEKIAGTYYMRKSSKGIRVFLVDILNELK